VERKDREGKKMIQFKIFDLYDVSEVGVRDPSLKKVINLDAKLVLKSNGRIKYDHAKTKVNVIERLVNIIGVPGSRGKKHRIITNWSSGKHSKNTKIVLDAFEIIAKKTGENPVAIFVRAIENEAPRDEVTSIEYGGARYSQAVDISPRRRLNLVLRFFANGAYDKSFNKKVKIEDSLAREIMLAAENSSESYAINKKNDIEKQADAAR
jgi:small subunit ribosomal protein S7